MHIRELAFEDATHYRALRLQSLQEEKHAFSKTYEEELTLPIVYFESYLADEQHIIFGAFQEQELFGIITLKLNHLKRKKHLASISSLYIAPAFRNQGVSKSIVAAAVMRAKELKCEQIHLTVNVENKIAKGIYTKFGFEIIGMEKQILKINDEKYLDTYRMALYFDMWKEY